MPRACCSSYHFAFKLTVIAEAEAIENNSKITEIKEFWWFVAGEKIKESEPLQSWSLPMPVGA